MSTACEPPVKVKDEHLISYTVFVTTHGRFERARATADRFLLLAMHRVFRSGYRVFRNSMDGGPAIELQFDPQAHDGEHEGHSQAVKELDYGGGAYSRDPHVARS